MAEESNVRLVRCPKCQTLIKELPDYSLYKCGSCGAILRAKKKELASNGSLDNSIEQMGELANASDTEICRVEGIISRRKERTFREKSNMNPNSVSSRRDNEKVFLVDDKNVKEHRHKHTRTEIGVGYVDNNLPSSKNPVNNWAQRDEHNMIVNRSKSVNSGRDSQILDYSPRLADFARSLRLKGVGRDGVGGFHKRSLGTIDEQDRFSALGYSDEGPSSYRSASVYGYHKPGKSFDVPNGVQNFENDRAQLLKKLQELTDQLSRSHDKPQEPRESVPNDKRMASADSLGSLTGNKFHRSSANGHRVSELTYSNHDSKSGDDHVQNFYGNSRLALKHVHRRMPEYGDSISPGMQGRPHYPVFHHRPQQRTYGYSSRQHMDFINEASYLNPEEALYDRPSCSCSHCYDKPPGLINRRFMEEPCNSTFKQYASSDRVGQHYLPRVAKCPQLNFQDPAGHVWPSDIDSDIDFARRYPRRAAALRSRNKQLCHPIAGGAPFITCSNCLQLLMLPSKFKNVMKKGQRLRCGACSTVIEFKIEKKGLIVSVPKSSKQRSAKAEEKSSGYHPSSNACSKSGGTITTSSNVENSGYGLISSKEKESPDNVIDWRDSPVSSHRNDVSPTVLSSTLQEQVKSSSSNQAVSSRRNGNRTKQQEKVIPMKNASQIVSEKNAPLAPEVEVSFSGYRNTSSSSQNSLEESKEENQLKLHKGSKSFLVGIIKKSFRDFSRSNGNIKNERPAVLVNGQPISDFAVRNAEKQAGPIQPGNYWYDSQAGFWGVMGQTCSGIIPPFIEEFNYPMLGNCAAGNTGVFVNGRELHQKDLDILASKGLPTTRDKSYVIEFSGRVLDQGTGIQLCSLGKLAPTVEKEKRGFGMQVPLSE
ncbi:hypothetical protein COLO4_21715 [Corchorus olitorius]|uniref:Uncharacterized protein n=1 Tax=Corchorus olitorius TaxID=93759 RepID=A0A1R3IRG8_9ROSI|nr:hypothetical protein COLO4_21715 [Corchorus olitorius]